MINNEELIERIYDGKGALCHLIFRLPRQIGSLRTDLSTPDEFLQLALISGNAGATYRPHVHLERTVAHTNFRAQESWVVMRGQVTVNYFSDEGVKLQTSNLTEGDVSISFRGGHGYQLLEDSLIYEFKTGPYLGQTIDKRFLD